MPRRMPKTDPELKAQRLISNGCVPCGAVQRDQCSAQNCWGGRPPSRAMAPMVIALMVFRDNEVGRRIASLHELPA
jgi:hypothetical protein